MDDAVLRDMVVKLLRGKQAHLTLEDALHGLPPELRAQRPEGLHSAWQLLEHMRIAQEDILRYTLEPGWDSPPWPEGYWPKDLEPSEGQWQESLRAFGRDLEEVIALAQDEATNLTATIPHGEGRTYLRQLLLVAQHNSYHTGQIVDVRRVLGAWRAGG